ncbi:MAG: Major facilitator superfamily domain-containing protein 1 [Marteilia pararefringens]
MSIEDRAPAPDDNRQARAQMLSELQQIAQHTADPNLVEAAELPHLHSLPSPRHSQHHIEQQQEEEEEDFGKPEKQSARKSLDFANSNHSDSKTTSHAPLDKTHEKILAFICICFLGFGSYFSYDSVAALQPHFLTDMKISTIQFMLFNSISQWSNVICSFLGGVLIDNVFGLRKSGIIFASAALLGQIIFTISISYNSYYTALLGRFILGLGTDSLATIQNAYTIHFFDSKNLNFLFGIHLTFLRLGSVLALNIQEPLYVHFGKVFDLHGYKLLGFTINISSIFVIFTTICSIVLFSLHKKHADRQNYKLSANDYSKTQKISSKKLCSESLIQEVISNLMSIDYKIWHLVLVLIFFYNGISPFSALGVYFLKKKYNKTGSQAGSIISSVDLTSAISAPFIGIVTDRYKNNVFIAQSGILLCILGMSLLNFTYIQPLFCIIIIGLGFSSISSSLWPFINIQVPKRKLGIVNGTISSIQALVLGSIVLISGHVVETKGYFINILLHISNLYFAFILNALFIQKYGNGYGKSIDNENEPKLLPLKNDLKIEMYKEDSNSLANKQKYNMILP